MGAKRRSHKDEGTEIVLVEELLLRGRRWSTRAELRTFFYDVDPDSINRALSDMEAEGVVHLDDKRVRVSPCARHVNRLIGPMIERKS